VQQLVRRETPREALIDPRRTAWSGLIHALTRVTDPR